MPSRLPPVDNIKIWSSVDNWQSALRKQYMKRDPFSNPLGPEPPKAWKTESREHSPENGDPQRHSEEVNSYFSHTVIIRIHRSS